MKFLSPMALITGLVLAVKDGISAMGSSMDWGVGKISAFLGGFLAGEFGNAGCALQAAGHIVQEFCRHSSQAETLGGESNSDAALGRGQFDEGSFYLLCHMPIPVRILSSAYPEKFSGPHALRE